MPTIDDLTVSLTIKDNSNLDKLRKNLDTVIKTGGVAGAGVGAVGSGKDIERIKKTLTGMQSQMNFLLPTVSPPAGDVVGMMDYGIRVSANLQKFKEKIADFLTPEKLGSLQDLAKDLNITELTTENMQEGVEKLIDKYDVLAQSIAKGELVMTGTKAKKYLDLISGIINDILAGGSNLTRLRQVEKAIPEDIIQRTLEKLMEKAGVTTKGQFQMFQVKDKFSKEEKKKLDDWIGTLDESLINKFKPMFEGNDVWTGLMRAMKELDFEPEQLAKLFTDLSAIEGNVDIENLIKVLIKLRKEDIIDFLALPKSFKELIQEQAGVKIRRPGKGGMTKLDINIFSGDVETLKNIIPTLSEATEKLIAEFGVVPWELKGLLGAGQEGSLELQSKIYGENLKVIASMITKDAREDLERWKVEAFTIPFFKDLMIEAGITTEIETQEMLKEAMKDVAKDTNLKEIKDLVERIDIKVATATSLEELKKYFKTIDILSQKIEKMYDGF